MPEASAQTGIRTETPADSAALERLYKELDASPGGLSSTEAALRLAQVGPNEPRAARGFDSAAQILRFFLNPLVIILLIASLASGLMGDRISAVLIAVLVLFSVVLNFAQTFRSQKAADDLRKGVAPTATVRRDHDWVEVPRRNLVPGDLIRVEAGAVVPADARLITERDLHVQQAALTGESLPVEKCAVGAPSDSAGADHADTLFLGTSVVSGTGTALVYATGKRTAFGDIAARLSLRPPETEFERGTRQFGLLIMKTVVFMVLFVLTVAVALKHNTFESLLFAVALAVGLTPEFLPMITSITLAQGAVRMARKKVIVKHLESIQNFGSMDVLCSDKTGTLTSGEMAVERSIDPLGRESKRVFELAYLNSNYETGIKSPLDAAILKQPITNPPDCRKLDEIPFDFERRRLSVVLETGGERLLIAKGAPEGILGICCAYEDNGVRKDLTVETRAQCGAAFERLSSEGYRVLAVAYRNVEPQSVYRVEDEREMVFAGFVAFSDPPLPEARETLGRLRAAGVALKILTGDNEMVARHVCAQVGLDAERIVLGSELDSMTDSALAHVAEQTTVFARVSPAQKNRILIALKVRGHVVGFLGDGINDAPSLHAADVGISVSSAVEVAKDAAAIILMEHNLDVLHDGILEGRKAFGNVMKYLLMGTSSNFGNMFSMAGASLLLPFLPMLPTQILLNNFLYDLAQVTIPTDNVDAGYITKPKRWNVGLIRNFMLYIGPLSSIYDFLTFWILLRWFHASEAVFHTGWFIESLATQTLVLFIIRTAGSPFRSRPSRPLTATTVGIVLLGIAIPFTPIAGVFGFVPMPWQFFVFLTPATITYLALVEIVKRRLMRHLAV